MVKESERESERHMDVIEGRQTVDVISQAGYQAPGRKSSFVSQNMFLVLNHKTHTPYRTTCMLLDELQVQGHDKLDHVLTLHA